MRIVAQKNPRLPFESWSSEYARQAFTTDPNMEGLLPHIPYARLNVDFDFKGMRKEAERLLPYFIDDNIAMLKSGIDPARSPRMRRISLDLCKLEGPNRWVTKTGLREANYVFTRYADSCPITMKFLQEQFPHVRYHDFGFRILLPGGYLDRHIDKFPGRMSMSFCLTNPTGAKFMAEKVGYIPMQAGEGWMINTENCVHKVENTSHELRIHLAINGEFTHDKEFRSLALTSFDSRNPDYNPDFQIQKTYPQKLELDPLSGFQRLVSPFKRPLPLPEVYA